MLTRTDAMLVAWTIATKLGVLALGVVAVWLTTGVLPSPLVPWDRWDAPHFFEVAAYGYGPPASPARIVLFPVRSLIGVFAYTTCPAILARLSRDAVGFRSIVRAETRVRVRRHGLFFS